MSKVWFLYDISQGYNRLIAAYDNEENARDAGRIWRRVHHQGGWSTVIDYVDLRHDATLPESEYPDDEVTE